MASTLHHERGVTTSGAAARARGGEGMCRLVQQHVARVRRPGLDLGARR